MRSSEKQKAVDRFTHRITLAEVMADDMGLNFSYHEDTGFVLYREEDAEELLSGTHDIDDIVTYLRGYAAGKEAIIMSM